MLQSTVGVCLAGFIAVKGLKSNLTLPGALTAFILGSTLFSHSAGMGLLLIIMYFTATRATKYKSDLKMRIEDHKTHRGTAQVICVGGFPLIASLIYHYSTYKYEASLFALVSLSVAFGDTLASEVGSVISSNPVLITTFKKVPPGTNGAVSLGGTIMSGIGGLLIGLTYSIAEYLFLNDLIYIPIGKLLVLSTSAGLVGSFIDSILGATIQVTRYNPTTKKILDSSTDTVIISGFNILTNEQVNLVSTLITSLIYLILF